MSGIVIGFYGLSIILFLGMIHYLVATSKQGMYPPKNLLKKELAFFA
ncbi:hypothetical protein [Bacillus coahuilensis]|nr:hypothetical protein [Bacillus coahuilensis]